MNGTQQLPPSPPPIDEADLAQRRRRGEICPQCKRVRKYDPEGGRFCTACGVRRVAYAPPRFPIALLVVGGIFFLYFAFFGALFAVAASVIIAVLYFAFALFLLGLLFIIGILVYHHRTRNFEKNLKRQLEIALSEKEQREKGLETKQATAVVRPSGTQILAYFDDLAAVDRAFSLGGPAAEQFEQGIAVPHCNPLRRATKPNALGAPESLAEMTEQLYRYAALCGLHLTLKTVKELLIAMLRSRVILLTAEKPEDISNTVALLAGFFDSNAHETVARHEWRNEYDMLGINVRCDEAEAVPGGATGVLLDLYCANSRPEHSCVTLLSCVDADFLKNCLSPLMKRITADVTDGRAEIALRNAANAVPLAHVKSDMSMALPQNVWFFCTASDPNVLLDVTVARERAITVSVVREDTEALINHFPCASAPVGHASLARLGDAAIEEHFLSETQWQKCDAFFAYLRKELAVTVGNKDILALEDVSSLALAFFVEEGEGYALDHALTSVLGARLCAAAKETDAVRDALLQRIEELFGMGALPALTATLRT